MTGSNKKYKVGITFGAFDPLHFGHVKLFERAKEQCDFLFVCVSDSDYIKKHKGRPERVPLLERQEAIRAIKYVGAVDIQSEAFSKKEAVKYFGADVIFVGDDWKPGTFTGEGLGAEVVYLPRTEGISSTEIWHTKE